MTWFGLKVFTRGAEVGTPRHTEFPPHAPPHGPCHVHNHTYTHTTTQRHTHHTRQIVAALKQYTLREGGTHWNRGAWQDCRAGPFPACLQPRHSRHTCTTPAAHSNRVAMAKLGQNYDYQGSLSQQHTVAEREGGKKGGTVKRGHPYNTWPRHKSSPHSHALITSRRICVTRQQQTHHSHCCQGTPHWSRAYGQRPAATTQAHSYRRTSQEA